MRMRRWFAIIPEKSFMGEMMPLQLADMEALLETPRTHHVVGIPLYYDVQDRVWPIAIDGCIIAKTDN